MLSRVCLFCCVFWFWFLWFCFFVLDYSFWLGAPPGGPNLWLFVVLVSLVLVLSVSLESYFSMFLFGFEYCLYFYIFNAPFTSAYLEYIQSKRVLAYHFI